jgi:hypothetical protein
VVTIVQSYFDDQDDLQDNAAANAVAVAAAIAATRILEVRYCLEVCGLNQHLTNAIILEGYSKTTDFSMMSSKRMDAIFLFFRHLHAALSHCHYWYYCYPLTLCLSLFVTMPIASKPMASTSSSMRQKFDSRTLFAPLAAARSKNKNKAAKERKTRSLKKGFRVKENPEYWAIEEI